MCWNFFCFIWPLNIASPKANCSSKDKNETLEILPDIAWLLIIIELSYTFGGVYPSFDFLVSRQLFLLSFVLRIVHNHKKTERGFFHWRTIPCEEVPIMKIFSRKTNLRNFFRIFHPSKLFSPGKIRSRRMYHAKKSYLQKCRRVLQLLPCLLTHI